MASNWGKPRALAMPIGHSNSFKKNMTLSAGNKSRDYSTRVTFESIAPDLFGFDDLNTSKEDRLYANYLDGIFKEKDMLSF